jgi:2-isopropylmalate synthase
MKAEDVGAPWNPLVLGKHSGRHAVLRRCKDLGLEVEPAELVEIYRALMTIADDRKIISDADIIAVVSNVRTAEAPSTPAHALHESGYGHGV